MTPNFHRLVTCIIAAGLSDARDDLVGNPALESFGFGLAAADDARIQAGFVHDIRLVIPST